MRVGGLRVRVSLGCVPLGVPDTEREDDKEALGVLLRGVMVTRQEDEIVLALRVNPEYVRVGLRVHVVL